MADEAAPMLVAGGGSSLGVSGAYDPKITPEIDRKIRNMPGIAQHCYNKAIQLARETGSPNFEVILSYNAEGGQSRPRAYVCPKNNEGIHEELSQAVLLKAAMAMAGR